MQVFGGMSVSSPFQVVQGFQGEILGEKCDRYTYHNAIAMLGLIQQKVPQHCSL